MNRLLHTFFLLLFALPLSSQVAFQADTAQGCEPLQVRFTNKSQSYASYQWYFGDGGNSTLSDPQHTYSQSGSYTVTLIGTNGNQSDTLIRSQYIQVNPVPNVQFTVQNPAHCVGTDSVHFINQSDTSYAFQWVIGNGSSYSAYSFTHQYQSAGNYQVALMAQNSFGCAKTQTLADPIRIRPLPDATFSTADSILCGLGSTAQFQAAYSGANQYVWDFGNGSTDSTQGEQASSAYSVEGEYQITLTVEDTFACRASFSKSRAIKLSDTSNLIHPLLSNYCSGEEIALSTDSTVVAASWKFGDGATVDQTDPSYQYSNAGVYQIEVNTLDSMGCRSSFILDSIQIDQSPIVQLKNQPYTGCAPRTLQIDLDHFHTDAFNWEIGGKQFQQAEPLLRFDSSGIYDFNLIVNNQLCADTLHYPSMVSLEGGQQPLFVSDTIGCAPLEVRFEALDTSLSSYWWHNGVGDSSMGRNYRYMYHQAGLYQPYLISESQNGCRDTTYLKARIRVQDAVENFQLADTIVLCRPGSLNFNGYAMGGNYWKWDFGDGDSSKLANPSHYFADPGIYDVSLLTENTFGCYNFYQPYNVVKVKSPVASFDVVRKNCPNFQVKLYDRTPDAVKWMWSFGDGQSDTVKNPVHAYSGAGYYQIRLRSWDADGCVAEKVIPAFEISVCQGGDSLPLSNLPSFNDSAATFSDSSVKISGCLPLEVSMIFPADTAKSYFWDFGDGNSSQLKNPTHTYQSAGIFDVSLIYQKLDNSYDTIINRNFIQVNLPEADFSFKIDNYCDSSEVQFQTQNKANHHYRWDLGSAGMRSEESPLATYYQTTNEVVSLTVTDSLLCTNSKYANLVLGNPNPFVGFDAYSCLGDRVRFTHNYRDFDSSVWQINGQSFVGDTIIYPTTDTGVFPIDLNVFDKQACSTRFPDAIDLTVSNPIANFSGIQNGLYCGVYTVTFNNQSTGANQFVWSFDDGDSERVAQPTHHYDSNGTYTPTLVAMKDGCQSTYQSSTTVRVNVPEVDFRVNQNSDCFPIQASFIPEAPSAVNYTWYFGDGDSSTLANPSHTYYEAPSSPIVLEILDTEGCVARIEKWGINIFEAGIEANRWSGCEPLVVNLTDTNANSTSWLWDFGDGGTSTLKNPTHTYADSGSYDISLISRSANGCYDTLYLANAIYVGNVEANFTLLADSAACAPHLTHFENLSQGAQSYQWFFDQHGRSTLFEPMQIFSKAGLFDVSLYASDNRGCVDSLRKADLMNINTPEAHFSISDSIFCGPRSVQFEDHSKRLISRKWYLGDGHVDSIKYFTHHYGDVGAYTVTLVVEDTANCVETISKTIRHKRKPDADFTIDTFALCSPAGMNFVNQSTNTDTATYWWSLNQQLHASSGADTIFNFEGSARYRLGFYVENKNQCRDTAYLDQELFTYRESRPDLIEFTEINRNLNGSITFSWPADSTFEFAYYQIYRKNGSGEFEEWERVYDWASSSYHLSAAESNPQGECFKIEIVNHCYPKRGQDSLRAFCAIDLETATHPNGIQLNWTAFTEMPNMRYQVLKASRYDLKFEPLAFLNRQLTSFVDSTAFCPEVYVYRIKADYLLNGQSYSSISDSSVAYPGGRIIRPSAIQINKASVIDNQHILLEWEHPQEMAALINGYYLYRSKLRSGKEIIAQLPANGTSYLDYDVDVSNRSYEYQLQIDHRCSVDLHKSPRASSILLQSGEEGEFQYLRWTAAQGLQGGVKEYVIQKMDEFGNWVEVKRVSANELQLILEDQ